MNQSCHASASPSQSPSKLSFFREPLALVLAAGSMLFAMPGMLGLEMREWFPWASFALSLVVTVGLGLRFFVAIPRLFYGANMNTLVGIGISAAYALSFWQWSRGEIHQLYFDSAAFVAAFVLTGQWVEELIHHKIRSKLPSLLQDIPLVAHRVAGANQNRQDIPPSELREGDEILVLPGERVPVDAVLISERTSLDESMLTGESKLVERRRGEKILQGAVNHSQPVQMKVIKASEESFLYTMLKEIDTVQSRKPALQKKVDRWASLLTPAVLLVATGAAVYWGYFEKREDLMVLSFVSTLIIACPCVIGIATPISLFVSVIKAVQQKILIRNLECVERSSEVTIVAFDKTGTLTIGRPRVRRFLALENQSHQQILQLAAAAESRSEHPYAGAILEKAREDGLKLATSSEHRSEPGKGVFALVEKEGKNHEVCVGSLVWQFENGVEPTSIPDNFRWEVEGSDETAIWVSVDRKTYGLIFLADEIRSESKGVVRGLKDSGYKVGLITGDSEPVAMGVAKALELDFKHFGVLPQEKATIVRRLSEKKKKGIDFEFPKVAYIGDGVNDAPALAEAHLGIAMGSGSAMAQTTADIVLVSSNLRSVSDVFEILRQSHSLVRQNLLWAFVYNVVAIPVAAGVLYPAWGVMLSPSLAAAVMSLSSISVLLNSLRALGR